MNLTNYWEKDYLKITHLYFTTYSIINQKNFAVEYFCLYMHKKLTYYLFSLFNKFYNFSNGQMLRKKSRIVKYFKKSKKSFSYVINTLNKKVSKRLKSIDIFYCKNFNLKNYYWLKKYFKIIKPDINYMICTNSWNYINIKKKRIKKKIYRNLIKKYKV